MAKTRTQYVCQNCGRQSPRMMGRCPACGEFNTMVEEVEDTGRADSLRRPARGVPHAAPQDDDLDLICVRVESKEQFVAPAHLSPCHALLLHEALQECAQQNTDDNRRKDHNQTQDQRHGLELSNLRLEALILGFELG